MNRQDNLQNLRPVLLQRFRAHGGNSQFDLDSIAVTDDIDGDTGDESIRESEQSVGLGLMESSGAMRKLIAEAL